MNPIERIARAALDGDALSARSLVQDWLESRPHLAHLPKSQMDDPTLLALSAALAELIAIRLGQMPPAWTADIGAAPHPIHLLKSAVTMRRLREMCEAEAPLPLRRRGIFAPPNYLASA